MENKRGRLWKSVGSYLENNRGITLTRRAQGIGRRIIFSALVFSLNAFIRLLFAAAPFLLRYRICVFAVGPNLTGLVQSTLMVFARLLRDVRPSAS